MPELIAANVGQNSEFDVHIEAASFEVAPQVLRETSCVCIAGEETLLFAQGVGAFLVRAGREIKVLAAEGASAKTVRLFLLGPGLAMLLHQRAQLVLHASAVALAGPKGQWVGIAFLGDSGQGKSTMGAALFERGHRALADDIVPLELSQIFGAGELSLPAGFPMFKLWPESVVALYEDVDTLPFSLPEAENYPRRERKAERDFELNPVPLRALFVLETSETIQCQPLSPAEALMALVRHSYWVAEFSVSEQAEHFEQCIALAQKVVVYRLARPRDLAQLSAVARVVETVMGVGSDCFIRPLQELQS